MEDPGSTLVLERCVCAWRDWRLHEALAAEEAVTWVKASRRSIGAILEDLARTSSVLGMVVSMDGVRICGLQET